MARALEHARLAAQADLLPRNLVINGSMQISQQYAGAAVTSAAGVTTYAVDMFQNLNNGVGATGHQRASMPTPDNNAYRLIVQVNTADAALAAGDYLHIRYAMEGNESDALRWGTADAKPLAVRFRWRANVAGTYVFAVRNDTTSRTYSTFFTIAAEEVNTDKLIEIVVPPCYDGAWSTGIALGLYFDWCIATGSTGQKAANLANQWVATANNAGQVSMVGVKTSVAVSNVFYLSDVAAYVGDVFPPYEPPSFEDELRRCQRYYNKTYNHAHAVGAAAWDGAIGDYSNASGQIILNWTFPVEMRNTPSMLVYAAGTGTANTIRINGADGGGTSQVLQSLGTRGMSFHMQGTAANAGGWGHFVANARL